jgi:hypothetical protein
MRIKAGTDNRKQLTLAAVVGVMALGSCIYIYEELFAGSTPPPAPPVATSVPVAPAVNAPAAKPGNAAGPAAKPVGTTSAALDPTLHMDAMLVAESVVYSGTGRNIFSANSVPAVPIPSPIGPARPQPIQVVQNAPPPAPAGLPPPPPINLKFFGVETGANGKREAFLLHDDTVYTAAAGDVVLRRYKVIEVEAKTIQVEDMTNNNKQTLALAD